LRGGCFARKFTAPQAERQTAPTSDGRRKPVIDRALIGALSRLPEMRGLGAGDLVPMTAKGVHHDHYRVRGRGLVLRVPRTTPWAGDAKAQLAGEAAAFARAEPTGVTPRLDAALAPEPGLPRGALLVEEIVGRQPELPRDLPAIARALARLHSLPLPAPAARAPLADHGVEGPIAATLALIARQQEFLARVDLAPETRAALEDEYAEAQRLARRSTPAEQPLALVGTDTHPGNFIMRGEAEAVLVDLERVCYGSPAIDLAHASLFTSTTWDLEVQAVLSREDVLAFYRQYLAEVGPERATALRPGLRPARRLTWLRTMMWAVRLRALDESGSLSLDPRLARHIRARLDDFFDPVTVARVRAEWLAEPVLEI
jgi:hypothetical protein